MRGRGLGGIRWIVIVGALVYGAFYYFTNQQTVPVTGRKQLVDISRDQEAALGYQSFRQILQQSNVVESGKLADQVRSIGQRIAKVADDPGFEWEFKLINDNQANAFCLPGGKVAVYTGILPIARSENGLAVIMGHEIAHAIARHGAERMAQQKLMQIGQIAAGVALSDQDYQTQRAVLGALGVGAQYGIMLPFSRNHESEADEIGLVYAAKACFDPTEAPKLWERMAEASQGQPAEFMSTHPSHETRIRQLNELMPKMLELRAQTCGGR